MVTVPVLSVFSGSSPVTDKGPFGDGSTCTGWK